jgi:hypothetical protein
MNTEIIQRMAGWAHIQDLDVLADPTRAMLADDPAPALVELLGALYEHRVPDELRYGLLALTHAILRGDGLSEARLRELHRFTVEADHHSLRWIFTRADPILRRGAQIRTSGDPLFDELPLGTRKWRARLHDHDLLARLTHDPDPAVVEILLENPRITEAHVVQIAARRPANPHTMARVLARPRWWFRQRVMQALALNPATPVSARIALLPFMARTDLLDMSRRGVRNEQLAESVRRVLTNGPFRWPMESAPTSMPETEPETEPTPEPETEPTPEPETEPTPEPETEPTPEPETEPEPKTEPEPEPEQ